MGYAGTLSSRRSRTLSWQQQQQHSKVNGSFCSCDESVDSATTSTEFPSVPKPQRGKVEQQCSSSKPCTMSPLSTADGSIMMDNVSSSAKRSCVPKSAPSCSSSPSSSSSSWRIRARYLQRLGVAPPSSAGPSTSRKKIAPLPQSVKTGSCSQQRRRTRRERSSSVEILKNDHGVKDETLTTESNPPSSPISSSVVRFQPSVEVHSVPSRNEYSNRIKQALWMPPLEMEEMVTRNSIEFASEGWDWRHAAEEEDFVCIGGGNVHQPGSSGEWIHPAHMIRRCNVRNQFFMIMSARQHFHQQVPQQRPVQYSYSR